MTTIFVKRVVMNAPTPCVVASSLSHHIPTAENRTEFTGIRPKEILSFIDWSLKQNDEKKRENSRFLSLHKHPGNVRGNPSLRHRPPCGGPFLPLVNTVTRHLNMTVVSILLALLHQLSSSNSTYTVTHAAGVALRWQGGRRRGLKL